MLTVDQLKRETAGPPNIEAGSAAELDEFVASSAGEKRVLVCTATANPNQVQYAWTVRDSGRQNDTSSAPTPSDFPAAERVIAVIAAASPDTDGGASFNRSVLILQDQLEVSVGDGASGGENAAEGVRTYVCTVNNTVGWDQCTIQVQGGLSTVCAFVSLSTRLYLPNLPLNNLPTLTKHNVTPQRGERERADWPTVIAGRTEIRFGENVSRELANSSDDVSVAKRANTNIFRTLHDRLPRTVKRLSEIFVFLVIRHRFFLQIWFVRVERIKSKTRRS